VTYAALSGVGKRLSRRDPTGARRHRPFSISADPLFLGATARALPGIRRDSDTTNMMWQLARGERVACPRSLTSYIWW